MLQETLIGRQLNLFTKICFIISRHNYCTLHALMRYAHAHARTRALSLAIDIIIDLIPRGTEVLDL